MRVAGFSGTMTAGATTLRISPQYEKCHAIILGTKFPATITMNFCDLLHAAAGKEPGELAATVDLECPEGKQLEMHVYSNHTSNTSLCTYKVPQQTGLGTVELTSKAGTPEDVQGRYEPDGNHIQQGRRRNHLRTFSQQY